MTYVPPKHEARPPEGSVCPHPACGVPAGRGHPRQGWVRVYVQQGNGDRTPARWFCGPEHAALDLAADCGLDLTTGRQPDPVPADVPSALAWFAVHAPGRLAEASLTPRRVQAAAEHVEQALDDEGAPQSTLDALAAAYGLLSEHAEALVERDREAGKGRCTCDSPDGPHALICDLVLGRLVA